MYDYEEIRTNWKIGDAAQKGDSPPAYRCALAANSPVETEDYDHSLYLKTDKVIMMLPYIQRRYFVIMNRERVILKRGAHHVLSEDEVYTRITRELRVMKMPVSAQFVKDHLINEGIKQLRSVIVRGVNGK